MKHGFKKVGTSKKNYDVKGEGDNHWSDAETNPIKGRKHVGNLKDVQAGRVAKTQDTQGNMSQTFEDVTRAEAAKDKPAYY